jgi:hypothetical protein
MQQTSHCAATQMLQSRSPNDGDEKPKFAIKLVAAKSHAVVGSTTAKAHSHHTRRASTLTRLLKPRSVCCHMTALIFTESNAPRAASAPPYARRLISPSAGLNEHRRSDETLVRKEGISPIHKRRLSSHEKVAKENKRANTLSA